ncbi:unknown [Clostridium sp. CAG:678]|nr:unknown [Clostridium sp. CAG:678]
MKPEFTRDVGAEFRGNDRFYKRGFFTERIFFHGEHKLHKKRACLIAGKEHIFPICVPHGDANSVAIRIRTENKIRADLFGIFYGDIQSVLFLRIRTSDGGKITIRQLLLFHHMNIKTAEHMPDRHIPRAVQRRINDFEI